MGFNAWLLDAAALGKKPSRQFVGYLEAWVSIIGNILLFILKFIFGMMLNSIALIADAFHTLSDVLTSIVVLIGFKIGGKPADREHPFGHGRVEQIATLVIAVMLFAVAIELGKSSFERILNPQPVRFNLWVLVFLVLSAALKEWMAGFSIFLGKKISSQSLIADAWHHRSDAVATVLVAAGIMMAGMGFSKIDGFFGMGVVLLLLWVVYDLIRTSSSFLMGEALTDEMMLKVNEMVLSVPGVINFHDLMVHDYQSRKVVSLHIEVKASLTAAQAHGIADKVEGKLKELMGPESEVTAHVDPHFKNR